MPYFHGKFKLPEVEAEPDASFHRGATFLTNMDVSNRNILNAADYYAKTKEDEDNLEHTYRSKVSKFTVEDPINRNDNLEDMITPDPNSRTMLN